MASSLRRLLADIFASNVKVETLEMDISALPMEFIEDIVVINMRRLPLRLSNEKANFDTGTEKYYFQDTQPDRKSRVIQEGPDDISADKAADHGQIDSWGAFKVGKTSKYKKKDKGIRRDATVQDWEKHKKSSDSRGLDLSTKFTPFLLDTGFAIQRDIYRV